MDEKYYEGDIEGSKEFWMDKLKPHFNEMIGDEGKAHDIAYLFYKSAEANGGDAFASAILDNKSDIVDKIVNDINEHIDEEYECGLSALSTMVDIMKNPRFENDELNEWLKRLYEWSL